MTKRNYRNNLNFIADAFRASWGASQDLVNAAKILMDSGHQAQALSLSVIALEELGKLFCIDGLLFARADDNKAETFAKALKSHKTKLSALSLLPALLGNIALIDARYGKDQRFNQAIAISVRDLKERGNAVLDLLNKDGFHGLDGLKQYGFYSHPTGNSFAKPSDLINIALATAVFMFAWRASSTFDFVLKGGNLERYIAAAKDIRAKMSEIDHQRISVQAEELFKAIFPEDYDAGDQENNVTH